MEIYTFGDDNEYWNGEKTSDFEEESYKVDSKKVGQARDLQINKNEICLNATEDAEPAKAGKSKNKAMYDMKSEDNPVYDLTHENKSMDVVIPELELVNKRIAENGQHPKTSSYMCKENETMSQENKAIGVKKIESNGAMDTESTKSTVNLGNEEDLSRSSINILVAKKKSSRERKKERMVKSKVQLESKNSVDKMHQVDAVRRIRKKKKRKGTKHNQDTKDNCTKELNSCQERGLSENQQQLENAAEHGLSASLLIRETGIYQHLHSQIFPYPHFYASQYRPNVTFENKRLTDDTLSQASSNDVTGTRRVLRKKRQFNALKKTSSKIAILPTAPALPPVSSRLEIEKTARSEYEHLVADEILEFPEPLRFCKLITRFPMSCFCKYRSNTCRPKLSCCL